MIALASTLSLIGAPLIAALPKKIGFLPEISLNSCGYASNEMVFQDQRALPNGRDPEGTQYLQFFNAPGHEDSSVPRFVTDKGDSSIFLLTDQAPAGVTLQPGYCLIQLQRGTLNSDLPFLAWAGQEHYKEFNGYASDIVPGTSAKYLQCRSDDASELKCNLGSGTAVPIATCPRKIWDNRQEVHSYEIYSALSLSSPNSASNCTKAHLYAAASFSSRDANGIIDPNFVPVNKWN